MMETALLAAAVVFGLWFACWIGDPPQEGRLFRWGESDERYVRVDRPDETI